MNNIGYIYYRSNIQKSSIMRIAKLTRGDRIINLFKSHHIDRRYTKRLRKYIDKGPLYLNSIYDYLDFKSYKATNLIHKVYGYFVDKMMYDLFESKLEG